MATLDYRNPADCLELLRRLHPTDLDDSHQRLREMVGSLLEHPPAPNQHLEILEAARSTIAFIQGELGLRYASHPLPPDSVENETLGRVTGLWTDLARSCAVIMRRDMEHHTLEDQYALLVQRRIHYTGQCLLEYFRAHRAVPAGQWTQLHDSYSVAEKMGVSRTRVADPLNEVWKAQSSGEAYAAVLLVDLANPFGRNQREFQLVGRWAQRFAPYCLLQTPGEAEAPGKYGLDMALDQGLRPIGLLAPSLTLRRFDGNRLGSQIQAALAQLKQGVSPTSLGLGDDCSPDMASRLLLSLYRPWGLAAAGRKYPRRGSRGTAEVATDWSTIAFYIHGQPFVLPKALRQATGLATDLNVLTFGSRASDAEWDDRRRDAYIRDHSLVLQNWQVADHSVGGFRLQRTPQGGRTEHHQLIGIRPPDGKQFLLGLVSWLMYRTDGVLEAGIYILPGIPQAVAVRSPGLGSSAHNEFHLAFLLPAVPALKTEASLVLPGGWFKAQRPVEIHGGGTLKVSLAGLVQRGSNFDQVTFTSFT
jgi:cyclic-di-GMP-binding protein